VAAQNPKTCVLWEIYAKNGQKLGAEVSGVKRNPLEEKVGSPNPTDLHMTWRGLVNQLVVSILMKNFIESLEIHVVDFKHC
jgi:hypothetical protein